MSPGQLQGRVALITGASRGIGRAIAQLFGSEGASVVVNYYSAGTAAQEVVEKIREVGGAAIAVQADVSNSRHVMRMFEEIRGTFGDVDILINNAGIHQVQPFLEISEEEWDRMISVDLKGAFLCTKEALPAMIARRAGHIVNIASDLGMIGAARLVHYSSAKGGLIAFTKSLAREVAPLGIRVNCLAPGPIETDMLMRNPEEYNEAERMRLPARRFGTADEVAASALFLVLPQSDFYIGQVLSPNGGTAI